MYVYLHTKRNKKFIIFDRYNNILLLRNYKYFMLEYITYSYYATDVSIFNGDRVNVSDTTLN